MACPCKTLHCTVLYAITVCSNSNAVSPWKLTFWFNRSRDRVISFIIWVCYSPIKSPGTSDNLVLQLMNISKNSFIQSFNTILVKKKKRTEHFQTWATENHFRYNPSKYIFLHKLLHWIPYIRHNSLLDVSTVIIVLTVIVLHIIQYKSFKVVNIKCVKMLWHSNVHGLFLIWYIQTFQWLTLLLQLPSSSLCPPNGWWAQICSLINCIKRSCKWI